MCYIATEEEMIVFGTQLAQACQLQMPPISCYLEGELGAGKTTLVRGFLQGYGHLGVVKSPTYTLVEPYQLNSRKIYHFDLYRLTDPEELEYIGIRDYLSDNAICLIEWANKGQGFVPPADIQIQLIYHQNNRLLTMTASSQVGEHILRAIM